MEELNKKIAEWVGFYSKVVTQTSADFNGIYLDADGQFKKPPLAFTKTLWHDPDQTTDAGCRDYWYAENGLPDFTHLEWGISHLFKWVVPRIEDPHIHLCQLDDGLWSAGIQWKSLTLAEEAETPALALCYAVEKLIDSQVPSEVK